MKITKYIHSCLLVEEGGQRALIDPGMYAEGVLGESGLENLDFLLITHEHPDHFHLPFVRQAVSRSPGVRVITNEALAAKLKEEGIEVATEGTGAVETEDAPHERIFMAPAPRNTAFHLFGKLTHPGDSLSFSSAREVLALPVQAPWGSTTWATDKALELKPKIVVPIHDWHWSEEARSWMYGRLEQFFRDKGMEFRGLEPRESFEV